MAGTHVSTTCWRAWNRVGRNYCESESVVKRVLTFLVIFDATLDSNVPR